MRNKKRIVKNAAYMFIANIIKKGFSFLLTLFIARYLGVDNYGIFAFSLSFIVLFAVLVDFGAQTLINREIARNKKDVNKYISNVIILKFIFSFIMILMVQFFAKILQYESQLKHLLLLSSIMYILQSFQQPFMSAFKGFEKLKSPANSLVILSLLKLIFSIIVITLKLGVKDLLMYFILANLITTIYIIHAFNFKIKKFKFEFNYTFAKTILHKSIPFGIASLFMILYDKIDITMLSKMVIDPNKVIGLYSAAYNLIWVFEFIPISIGASIYSYTSIAFLKNKPKFNLVYNKLVKYSFYFTIPLAIGTTVLAKDIIILIYGNGYEQAYLALQILIWAVVFKFQMYALGIILNSMGKEKITMKITLYSLIINIVSNLFLIPKYSFIGACFATVFSEGFYFISCFIYTNKHVKKISITKTIFIPITISLFMVFVISLPFFNNIFMKIFFGASFYIGIMALLKTIDEDDIRFIKNILKKH